MAKKVYYLSEVKWEAVNMKLSGHSTSEVMGVLGIKNKTQVKTWLKWYRNGIYEKHV